MGIRHRWEMSRMVEVVVGDDADSWRSAGFTVDDDVAVIAGVRFRLVGSGGERGVHGCTVEADTPAAAGQGAYTINGFTWQVQSIGTAPDALGCAHANGVAAIQKLEICPVEAWATLTELVHVVLPPPYTAFAHRNPSGDPQHVALWRMQNMEVFEMADAMGQTVRDEMAMFFFVADNLDAAINHIGPDNMSDPFQMGEDRRGAIIKSRTGLSVRTFVCEPPPVEK